MKLYNTLGRKVENFRPITDKQVKLYTCGPTVYHYAHIGNLRNVIFNDTLKRTLQVSGYQVNHVMNITDVGHLVSDADDGEDKLEKGAAREGKTVWEVAEYYIEAFNQHTQALNVLPPSKTVRATDAIPAQLAMVQTLLDKGFAYQTEQAIYFDVSKLDDYGKLSGQKLSEKEIGARSEVVTDQDKRRPQDFALWFFTVDKFADHQMHWTSPWGEGFPGWHLECSAIIHQELGETIDIHTGGVDHIGTHHTNEIAQSEAASGKLFSRFWLHNNHLKSNGTKISKSLGNGYTLQDLEAKGFTPMDYRMFALQSQYTNESNFTWENLEAAKNRLHHWRNSAALRWQTHDTLESDHETLSDDKTISLYGAKGAIKEALNDNLNTPEALRIVDQAFSQLDGKPLRRIHQTGLEELLKAVDEALGLQLLGSTPDISDANKQRILERNRVREAKDWTTSDTLRDELEKEGIVLRDTSSGSIWEYV